MLSTSQFGGSGAAQRGIGGGAFLTLLALLFVLCHGLAYRGVCRGDLFTTSTIGLVVLLIGIFKQTVCEEFFVSTMKITYTNVKDSGFYCIAIVLKFNNVFRLQYNIFLY